MTLDGPARLTLDDDVLRDDGEGAAIRAGSRASGAAAAG